MLVFSQYIETRLRGRLLAGGAAGVGYLLKDRVADVTEFMRRAAPGSPAGGTALDPEVVSQLLGTARDAASGGLDPRGSGRCSR